MLTASTHIVIPVLIGRGLTEASARATLAAARAYGSTTAQIADGVVPVSYAHEKYTIGKVR